MKRSLWLFFLLAGIAAAAPAQLATQRAGTSQLLIPAAGAVTGANGTFFRSDITVVNLRSDADQLVRFMWMSQGVSGVTTPVFIDKTIPKGGQIASEDFVTDVLGQSGLGSILVTAMSGTQFDSNGELHASARIWSNQPNLSTGTVSQSFPVIAVSDIDVTAGTLVILGQRRDDRYRSNVGIVNLDPQEQTFRVTLTSDERSELQNVVVPPLSMQQLPLPGPTATNMRIAVLNVSPGPQTSRFLAYGSTVDNATGDSWSSLGYVPPQ
ncbi:MAG TPA: hypothetical protein VL284_03055 [Thermoanaerobaculia bacterium]|nr:hypothetical protein [Thermoanaerobaculia bacterium]